MISLRQQTLWSYAALGSGLVLLLVAIGLLVASMTAAPHSAEHGGINRTRVPSDGSPVSIALHEGRDYGFYTEDAHVSCSVMDPLGRSLNLRTINGADDKDGPERLAFHADLSGAYDMSCAAYTEITLNVSTTDPIYKSAITMFLLIRPTLAGSAPLIVGGAIALISARRRRARELAYPALLQPVAQWAAPGAGGVPGAPPASTAPAPHAPAYPSSVYGASPYPGCAPYTPPAGSALPPTPPSAPQPQHPYTPSGPAPGPAPEARPQG